MARTVDLDKLDKDDVAYLRQRPWLIEEAKQVHGVDDIEDRLADVEGQSAEEEAKLVKKGDYKALTWKQLRELAASRQLDSSGPKGELVQRLEEDDEYQKKLAKVQSEPEPEGEDSK